jgi:uncharacterized protein (DUF952 family)
MNQRWVYHIATKEDWQRAVESGRYRSSSLDGEEGFIHASFEEQVLRVANGLFAGRQDLVLLKIELADLLAEVRLEASPEGELFPHLYGALNLDAVQTVWPLTLGEDGQFVWPGAENDRNC